MSLNTHRCLNCGHPDYWRGKKEHCPECGHVCTPGGPELVPTFDLAGQPVERIVVPGARPMGPDIPTCDCRACKALYAELTGAAA